MDNEDYATNDTAHGGACLTPADLEEEPNVCPECGHAETHGRYGCEHERGDAWIDGVLVARGPCGCTYNETLEALKEYAAAVKRTGKALMNLGRACDREGGVL